MDPKECLRQADQAISDLNFLNARMALSNYWQWRQRGGFEPIEVAGTLQRGDDFARDCKRRLDSAMGTKPVDFTLHIGGTHGDREEGPFSSLDSMYLWLLDRKDLMDDPDNQIWSHDTLGNSWTFIDDRSTRCHRWKPNDIVVEQFPINELPPRAIE